MAGNPPETYPTGGEPQVWTTSQRKRSAGSANNHNPCGHWHSVSAGDLENEDLGCGDVSIGYTTQQMKFDEIQQLTIVNPNPGVGYGWRLLSGGGQINQAGTYTAPHINPYCGDNPLIGLMAGRIICDTLEIAISGSTSSATAAYSCYEVPFHLPHPGDMKCFNHQGCSGIWGYTTSDFCAEHCGPISGNTGYGYCADIGLNTGITDVRTEAMKKDGCCVEMLL